MQVKEPRGRSDSQDSWDSAFARELSTKMGFDCQKSKRWKLDVNRTLFLRVVRLRHEAFHGSRWTYNAAMNPQALAEDDLHIWYIHLDRCLSQVSDYRTILSGAERSRALRFYFQRDRERYLIAHGALRYLLGLYADRNPRDVSISRLANGKPVLTDVPLEFNLAHSNDMAVIAIARRKVGVDIECLRTLPDAVDLAQRFFPEAEALYICQLPEKSRDIEFLRCWTRKEAYLKGCGVGLTVPLRSVSTGLNRSHNRALLTCNSEGNPPSCWKFAEFHLHPSYLGSVAVKGGFDRMEEFLFHGVYHDGPQCSVSRIRWQPFVKSQQAAPGCSLNELDFLSR
jgi:4'-phosphopantetheinyl transferase